MTVFTAAQTSMDGAVTTLARNVMNRKSTTEDAVTLTASEVVNAIYHQTGTPGTSIKTLPAAAVLWAYITSAAVGTGFDFIIHNGGDDTLTLAADTGATITLFGTLDITAAKTRKFRFVFTSATAAVGYAMAEIA
jgi:hypothetical protein